MRIDQWHDMLDRIAGQFAILEQGEEPLEDVPKSRVMFVVFAAPIGRVRLERVEKPRTIGERAVGSRRIGSVTAVEQVYDEGDLVSFLRAYRWDEEAGTWEEVRADHFTA